MAKCDLCHQNCSATGMKQLLGSYQVAGVVDICPDCAEWADKKKRELQSEIGPAMRQAIAERIGKPRRNWLQRLLKR